MNWKTFWLVSALALLGECASEVCQGQDLPPAPAPVANGPGSPITRRVAIIDWEVLTLNRTINLR